MVDSCPSSSDVSLENPKRVHDEHSRTAASSTAATVPRPSPSRGGDACFQTQKSKEAEEDGRKIRQSVSTVVYQQSIPMREEGEGSRPARPPSKRRCCMRNPVSGLFYPWQDAVYHLSDQYRIIDAISHGTFSQVYLAEPREATGFRVALKCIHASSTTKRVFNEVQALLRLGGKKHVIPLLLSHQHHDGTNTLVLPFVPHKDFRSYFRQLNVCQVRKYMHALFESLHHIHSESILHRDVKPSNFLYDIEKKDFVLVDFGLCETERNARASMPPSNERSKSGCRNGCSLPDDEFMKALKREVEATQKLGISHKMQLPGASRSGTRGFRAPEVLLRVQRQTSAIDMWSAGVILLSILGRRFPFFHSNTDESSLIELSQLFGSEALFSAAAKVGRVLTLPRHVPSQKLVDVCQRLGGKEDPEGETWPKELYDLLKKLLELVPSKRISAKEALNHAFFNKL